MMKQNSALYWYDGEQRINDELQMSNLRLISVVGSPYASLNMRDELKHAADTQNADISILIYKTDFQNASLMVYANGAGNGAHMYSQYDFVIVATEDATEIVALKTAEVVQETLNGLGDMEPSHPPAPRRSLMVSRLKIAMGLGILGMVALGVGGVFHGITYHHINEMDAAKIRYKDAINRASPSANDAIVDYAISQKLAEQNKVGLVIGYSIGGALIAASTALFLSQRVKMQENNSPRALFIRGASVAWEF
ncbi:MAG: hypothetical protein JXR76_00085 [Deltaproteobacteria bacterium]|nr:hypothetical protein [Deltaproteobacteria bacterium]